MKDQSKTKKVLIQELASLRQRIAVLERSESERKRLEEALGESEERYDAIFDRSLDCIYVVDFDGNFIDANRPALTLLGYERTDIRSLNIVSLLDEKDLSKGLQDFSEIIQVGFQKEVGEYRLRCKDGRCITLETKASVVYHDDKPHSVLGIARDITNRKQAEEAIGAAHQRLSLLVQQSPLGVIEWNTQFEVTSWNPAAEKIFGYSTEEAMGRHAAGLIVPAEFRPHVDRVWQNLLNRSGGERSTNPNFTKDGRIIQCEWFNTPVIDPQGRVVCVASLVMDVTEQKLAEEALQKSEEMLRLITDNMSDMIRVTDLHGVNLYTSPSHFKGLGYRPEDRSGKSAFDIVHPDDLERIINIFSEGLAANQRVNVEYRVRHADGHYVWLETVGDLLRDAQGNVTAVVMSSRDVSDRIWTENALRENKEQYRSLVENASDIVFRTDSNGHFTFVNPAAVRITGYGETELIGKHYPTLIRPDMRDEAIKFFGRQFVKGINNTYSEYPILTKDGRYVWLGQNTQLIAEDGHVTGFQAVSRDIAERKQAEEMLRKSEEKFRFLTENMNDNIFTMNLNLQTTYVSKSIEKILGFTPEERMKQDVTQQVTPESMTLIGEILSEELEREAKGLGDPRRSRKFEVEYYHKDGSKVWMENVISGIRNDQGVAVGIHGVSRDITERKRSERALKDSLDRLHISLGATIQAMAVTVETRDPDTAGHQRRVADLARSIAKEMNLPSDQIEGLRMASTIHDLGKISVPAEILSKPKKLTDVECELIKTHARSGYDILKDIDFPWPVARIILEHHEKMDGSGYPNGSVGENILLESRILAVADVVEAMASHRPYRPSLGIDAAFKELEENKGTRYDAAVVEACLNLFREKGYQFVKA